MLAISVELNRVVACGGIGTTHPLFPVADADLVVTTAILLHSSIEQAESISVLRLIELNALALERRPRRVGAILELQEVFIISASGRILAARRIDLCYFICCSKS